MKLLPPGRRRSPKRASKGVSVGRSRRGVKPSKARRLAPPALFVATRGEYGGMAYAPARIKLKRDGYRYLVWTESGRRREFYLGKVKILAPSDRADRGRQARAGGAPAGDRAGGKKREGVAR